MEQLISKEEQSEKKPLNIVLLGDESSEKEKLMSKFLLLNSPQFQENEMKSEEDKEEDISLFHNIIHCIEIHGEKLKMKLWDNPSTDEFLSPSIKIAQGILLFYSVKNKKSYEKIQKDLSKIIELGRFDIPIIVIGNHKNSEERKVTYEEAKTWADNYGLRFYETSLEKDGSIKEILQDIGEQLLFQECIFSANNSVIINDEEKEEIIDLEENLNIGFLIESKNKESEKKEKEKIKNEKNKQKNSLFQLDKIDIIEKNYSSNNIFGTNSEIKNSNKKNKFIKNTNKNNGLYKINSSNNFQKTKSKINTYNKPNKEKEDKHLNRYNTTNYNSENISNNTHNKIKSTFNSNSNTNKISNLINYSKLSIINKTKNLFKKNSSKNLNKTTSLFHSKKNSVNTLELSSPDAHSYLKKTTLTKNREKEVKEKKIKIEKELQTISAQKEREGIELKKKKNLEDKENYLKKIKEDKITQKEKEKKKKEDEIKSAKNNYDKLKQEKELISQEKKIEKEKDKQNKLALKQSEKEKYNKRVEELNKEREKVIENVKSKKERDKEKEKIKEKNNVSPNKHRKESSSFNLTNNYYNKFKSENINNINKSRKDSNKLNKEKEKEINKEKEKELNEKIISIKIGKEIKEKAKTQEEYKNNFINNNTNEDIYRCLKCNSIPKIFFHENNQEIEVICDHSNLNHTHHNILSYQNFQTKILDKSLYENIFCYFCNKSLNKLEHNEMIYYCPLCKFWFCSKDENSHIKQKHQNEFDIKNKYKNIITPKNNKRRNSIEFDMNKKQNLNNHPTSRRLSLKSKQDLKESKESETKSTDNNEIHKKKLIKIPIYLLDIFCKYHYEKYTSYCYNCNKNICNLCQKERHKEHNIEIFDNIMLDEVELNKKKIELEMIKENLSKINEYFIALIEAIKCRFERLYKAKQKEIEIKEKIIKDYEKIKYNYNSILNIKNLNLNNKQNFINSTNNINWIERLNLIFEYLNCSLTNEKSNIFRDLNNSNKYKKENIYINNNEIKNIIKLNDDNIALINDKNELKIYSLNNFREILNVNIFKKGEEINHIIKLSNNELACCGHEQIKFINFDSINQTISVKNIIKEKNNNFLSLIELTNDYLISSGTSKKIQLWNKNIINIYKCLNELNDIEINLLYNIIDMHSFIGCSYNNKKIKKYLITNNKEIIIQNELNNISIIRGNNSIIKYDSNLFINYKEKNEFGTLIINIDKFEILSKISSVKPLFFINNHFENENLISIDETGFAKKWKFSKKDNKLYECDKIKIYNNNMKLKDFVRINNDNFLLRYPNNIILYNKNKEYS